LCHVGNVHVSRFQSTTRLAKISKVHVLNCACRPVRGTLALGLLSVQRNQEIKGNKRTCHMALTMHYLFWSGRKDKRKSWHNLVFLLGKRPMCSKLSSGLLFQESPHPYLPLPADNHTVPPQRSPEQLRRHLLDHVRGTASILVHVQGRGTRSNASPA
jgi:hypothetical protein